MWINFGQWYSDDSKTWKCLSCTFINHNDNNMTKCEMCNTPNFIVEYQTNPTIIIIDELLTIFDGDTGTIKGDGEERLDATLQS